MMRLRTHNHEWWDVAVWHWRRGGLFAAYAGEPAVPSTVVLRRCLGDTCDALTTIDLRGVWTLAQVRGDARQVETVKAGGGHV